MIIIFVSVRLAAAAMYRLGVYVTLVTVITAVIKLSLGCIDRLGVALHAPQKVSAQSTRHRTLAGNFHQSVITNRRNRPTARAECHP